MPLQNRAAKGNVAAAEAYINALEWKRRQSEEQILAEIAQLSTNLTAAERLAVLARDEEVQAEKLAAGERRLFQAGASDFFLVNLREDAAANAAIRRLDAEFRLAQALALLALALLAPLELALLKQPNARHGSRGLRDRHQHPRHSASSARPRQTRVTPRISRTQRNR